MAANTAPAPQGSPKAKKAKTYRMKEEFRAHFGYDDLQVEAPNVQEAVMKFFNEHNIWLKASRITVVR